jgi:hypothetical protein
MRSVRFRVPGLVACTWLALATAFARADAPPRVSGERSEVQGLRVLRVWGTPQQRGYAHGYLMAREIVDLIEHFIEDPTTGSTTDYALLNLPMARAMFNVPPAYRREMEAVAEGVLAKLGPEGATIKPLGRTITYDDVLVINCASDGRGPMCSSFAVWGSRTADGRTITGRNLDWFRFRALEDNQFVLVQAAVETRGRAGWISVTWPGIIGCLTGMNEHGVTLAVHDVPVPRPERPFGLVPRPLVFREALERAAGPDVTESVAAVFRRHRVAVGSNAFVSSSVISHPAAVLEYDGRQEIDGGVTIRRPAGEQDEFVGCTNHYQSRAASEADGLPSVGFAETGRPHTQGCDRYQTIEKTLRMENASAERFDVDAAWSLLAEVSVEGERCLTHHSVVFEPDRQRLHVALSEQGRSAPRCRRVTIDARELLQFRKPTEGRPSDSRDATR